MQRMLKLEDKNCEKCGEKNESEVSRIHIRFCLMELEKGSDHITHTAKF